MCKVFLGVSSGEDGHVEDGPIGMLHLQTIWHFLGGYEIHRWDVRDGWLATQLPFLALGVLP